MYRFFTLLIFCLISFAAVSQSRIVRYYENGEVSGAFSSLTHPWTLGFVMNFPPDSIIDIHIPDNNGFYSIWVNVPYGIQDTMHGYWLEATAADVVDINMADVDGLIAALATKLSAEVDGSTTNEIELPSQASQGGEYLKTDGTTATWEPVVEAAVNSSSVTRAIPGSTGTSSTWTPSASKHVQVNYVVQISCSASIGSASSGVAIFQYSTNSGSSWIDAGEVRNSNTVTLAIALNATTIQTSTVSWTIPPGALCRWNVTYAGTTTISYIRGQEVALN